MKRFQKVRRRRPGDEVIIRIGGMPEPQQRRHKTPAEEEIERLEKELSKAAYSTHAAWVEASNKLGEALNRQRNGPDIYMYER